MEFRSLQIPCQPVRFGKPDMGLHQRRIQLQAFFGGRDASRQIAKLAQNVCESAVVMRAVWIHLDQLLVVVPCSRIIFRLVSIDGHLFERILVRGLQGEDFLPFLQGPLTTLQPQVGATQQVMSFHVAIIVADDLAKEFDGLLGLLW